MDAFGGGGGGLSPKPSSGKAGRTGTSSPAWTELLPSGMLSLEY